MLTQNPWFLNINISYIQVCLWLWTRFSLRLLVWNLWLTERFPSSDFLVKKPRLHHFFKRSLLMPYEAEHAPFHTLICSAFFLHFEDINSYFNKRKAGPKPDLLRCLPQKSPFQLFWLEYALRKHLLHIVWHFLSNENMLWFLFANFKSHVFVYWSS